MTYGWKERLEIEHDELVNRISSLSRYIDDEPLVQDFLLQEQLDRMREYCDVLKRRLELAHDR
jgi:hypothetical protein